MSGTDFFDEDLIKKFHDTRRQAAEEGYLDEMPDEDGHVAASQFQPRPIGESSSTSVGRHSLEISDQAANVREEIERLRERQSRLEREKQSLEQLRAREYEYQTGKQELIMHLNQSLVNLEREELEAEKLREMVGVTRKKFKKYLTDLQQLNEEDWEEEQMQHELSRALVVLENVREEYNRSISRIEGATGGRGGSAAGNSPGYVAAIGSRMADKSMLQWLVLGFAVSLPLIVTLVVLFVFLIMVQLGFI